ncbi:Peroxyureidoacrylate/ureidoacrylate amidohydrolase RutB [compost metagenome]
MKMNTLEHLLAGTRPALVIVDVQNDYCHPEGALGLEGCDVSGVKEMMPRLHGLLGAVREEGIPVIFIQTFHEDATDSEAWVTRSSGRSAQVCRKGSWGAEFFEIAPRDGEIVVNKHRYSAFVNTRLDSVLRTLKIDTLLVTGVSTNVCVESTARDGFMLDYHIVLVEDDCASYSREAHEMTLTNIHGYFGTVTASGELMDIWAHRQKSSLAL